MNADAGTDEGTFFLEIFHRYRSTTRHHGSVVGQPRYRCVYERVSGPLVSGTHERMPHTPLQACGCCSFLFAGIIPFDSLVRGDLYGAVDREMQGL